MMKEAISEISQLTSNAGTDPTKTELPGVWIIKGEVPQHQLAAIYEPMIGFVVQGSKTITIGDQVIYAKAPSYFVVPLEIPVTGRVHQGSEGLPYLSVGLSLNLYRLMDLLNDISDGLPESNSSDKFMACDATPEFIDAWLRLLRLLKNPEDIPALAPAYEREILYRVLLGPQGWRLKQLCHTDGDIPNVHQSVKWLRESYTEPIEVKQMADKAGMGVTTFHRKFKQMTGLSPIQFQKELRLLEARKLLVYQGYTVGNAAYEVGYNSPSQFNREYSRFFGASPAKDASDLKELENQTNGV